jgi:hypothetical protein
MASFGFFFLLRFLFFAFEAGLIFWLNSSSETSFALDTTCIAFDLA